MKNEFGNQPEENPSKRFHRDFLNKWKADPADFINSIFDHVDPSDNMGTGPMYVSQAIERDEILAEEFDSAAVEWLNQINIPKILENFKNKSGFPISYKIENLLLVVIPNRKGSTKFPKAVAWFRANKEALRAISITDDGGHWENRVKRILSEYI